MSTKRKNRGSTKKARDPMPMPVMPPVNEAHVNSSQVSSSPREPQTLRSFMDEYKKKLKRKNALPPKMSVSKYKEKIAFQESNLGRSS